MKRVLSLLTMVVMCFMLAVPAFAVGPQEPQALATAVGTSDGASEAWAERVILSDEQCAMLQSSEIADVPDNNNVDALATSYPTGVAGVYIEEIYGYPLLLEYETGALFYVPGIQTGGVLAHQTQSESLQLTTQQALNLYQRLLSYAVTNGTAGYHYSVVGWYVDTKIATRADYPMYVKYTVGTPNFSGITEERTVNITSNGQWVRVGIALGFPDNFSETEYYHMNAVSGSFTYKAAFNNNILSIPFFSGMSFNCDAA